MMQVFIPSIFLVAVALVRDFSPFGPRWICDQELFFSSLLGHFLLLRDQSLISDFERYPPGSSSRPAS